LLGADSLPGPFPTLLSNKEESISVITEAVGGGFVASHNYHHFRPHRLRLSFRVTPDKDGHSTNGRDFPRILNFIPSLSIEEANLPSRSQRRSVDFDSRALVHHWSTQRLK
jgi:hypothetical protein